MSRSPLSEDSFSGGASPPPPTQPRRPCLALPRAKRGRGGGGVPPGASEEGDAHLRNDESEQDRAKRQRKEQRMHRNRQSAARSRKRKEDRLARLSEENQSLRDEVERLKSQLAAATSKGFAAVKPSNFIVLMKLAAMFLIINAISVVVVALVGTTPSNHLPAPSWSVPRRPKTTATPSVPRFAAGFATAVMPFALPATPVR